MFSYLNWALQSCCGTAEKASGGLEAQPTKLQLKKEKGHKFEWEEKKWPENRTIQF